MSTDVKMLEVLRIPKDMTIEQQGPTVTFYFPTVALAETFFELFKTTDYCGFRLGIIKE